MMEVLVILALFLSSITFIIQVHIMVALHDNKKKSVTHREVLKILIHNAPLQVHDDLRRLSKHI